MRRIDGGQRLARLRDLAASHGLRMTPQRAVLLRVISETRDHGSRVAKIDDAVRLVGVTHTLVYALPFSPYISQQLDTARGSNKDEWGPGIDFIEKLAAARQAMRKNSAKALASMTGGEYESFATRKGFESDMLSFANHLHSRYLLSFEPKNPHPGLHRIRVSLKHAAANQTVLYRSTYWVADSKRRKATQAGYLRRRAAEGLGCSSNTAN